MSILQGVWKQHLRPRAVVGYGVKIFLPSPPNYVTRSPGRHLERISRHTSVISPSLSASPSIVFKILLFPLTASNSSGRHSKERFFSLNSDRIPESTQGRVRRVQSCNHRPCTTICTKCIQRKDVASQPSDEDTSIMAWKEQWTCQGS